MNTDSPATGTPGVASATPARVWLDFLSIRTRLSIVFVLFLLIVAGLGAFGIHTLNEVNAVSIEIRDHWLQATRALGDLSNFMSDYRAAEGTQLLSQRREDVAGADRDVENLARTVSRAQRDYEALPRLPVEISTYQQFATQWQAYQATANDVLALSRGGQKPKAVELYLTTSQEAFRRASETLARLTDLTVRQANEATTRADATYARARELIWLAIGLATLLLIVAVLFVSRSVTNPLLDMARRMGRLAENDTALDIPGAERHDEMGVIARAVQVFRHNAVALITTRNRLLEQTSELEAALEHERQLTAEQRNFVSMTSHEFRTPLTIIDGHAQRLLRTSGRADPEEVADRAARIRGAVERMTSIMNGLLGASRLLDGSEKARPIEFDLGPLVHEVCQMHRESLPPVRIEETDVRVGAPLVGDPTLIFHAVSNLVANAVKYSRPGESVEVRLSEAQGERVVSVLDRGAGIDPADREHLFERYFRGRNATTVAGTGVGLHLVAFAAKLHDGRIEVADREGGGTCFTLRLPVRQAAEPA